MFSTNGYYEFIFSEEIIASSKSFLETYMGRLTMEVQDSLIALSKREV